MDEAPEGRHNHSLGGMEVNIMELIASIISVLAAAASAWFAKRVADA